MWCQTEELQTKMTIIHSLENRLTAINEEHEAEMQRQTQKVHFMHVSKKLYRFIRWIVKFKQCIFVHSYPSLQLKQEFSEEVLLLEEALKQERRHLQEEMKKLSEELREKHKTELSGLRLELDSEMHKERANLKKALNEEKEKLKSLQAALDNGESKEPRWLCVEDPVLTASSQISTILYYIVCLSGPEVLIAKQRLEAQHDNELKTAKSCMAAEIKELTALLQEQAQQQLSQAQERWVLLRF